MTCEKSGSHAGGPAEKWQGNFVPISKKGLKNLHTDKLNFISSKLSQVIQMALFTRTGKWHLQALLEGGNGHRHAGFLSWSCQHKPPPLFDIQLALGGNIAFLEVTDHLMITWRWCVQLVAQQFIDTDDGTTNFSQSGPLLLSHGAPSCPKSLAMCWMGHSIPINQPQASHWLERMVNLLNDRIQIQN